MTSPSGFDRLTDATTGRFDWPVNSSISRPLGYEVWRDEPRIGPPIRGSSGPKVMKFRCMWRAVLFSSQEWKAMTSRPVGSRTRELCPGPVKPSGVEYSSLTVSMGAGVQGPSGERELAQDTA